MKNILTKEEFFAKIDEETQKMSNSYSEGQKVFDAIANLFDVARVVQLHDGIDCFDDDSKIELFKEKAYETYKELEEHSNLYYPEFLKDDVEEDE